MSNIMPLMRDHSKSISNITWSITRNATYTILEDGIYIRFLNAYGYFS